MLQTGRVEISHVFASPAVQPGDLTWDGTDLWHVDRGRNCILRLDADTGAVLGEYGFVGRATGIAAWNGELWIVDADVPMLCRIDLRRGGAVVGQWPLPLDHSAEGALSFDGELLWQVDVEHGTLVAINPQSGTVQEVLELSSNIAGVSCSERMITYADFADSTIRCIDRRSHQPLARYPLPGNPLGITRGGDRLWYIDDQHRQICQLRLL